MYTIHHSHSTNVVSITNTDTSINAKIYLNQGASLQELTLGGHAIIQDLSPLHYANTYASSLLFPFANRIEDGAYNYENRRFQFEKNLASEQNALHGLIFDKTFKIVDECLTKEQAQITLEYIEKQPPAAFPYTYKVQLTYTLKPTNLSLKMSITNTSNHPFPYTLGWHPYFVSSDLFQSEVIFNSSEKMLLDERNITTGTSKISGTTTLKIENKKLDDCWALKSPEVLFKTPKYSLKFNTNSTNNFLQIYTPPKANVIAIEPTTGVSNSFNNKIGLEILEANATKNISWDLNITDI